MVLGESRLDCSGARAKKLSKSFRIASGCVLQSCWGARAAQPGLIAGVNVCCSAVPHGRAGLGQGGSSFALAGVLFHGITHACVRTCSLLWWRLGEAELGWKAQHGGCPSTRDWLCPLQPGSCAEEHLVQGMRSDLEPGLVGPCCSQREAEPSSFANSMLS